jgi:hypothetical protein
VSWFLVIIAVSLGLGLSRRRAGAGLHLVAIGAVFVVLLYAGLTTHAI